MTIHNGSDFHIRKTAYELAKLFDQRKAWYCKDEDCEDTDLDFFHWMQFMIKKYGGPKDYNINEILRMGQDGCDYVEPHPFYHDTFLECKIDDELEWSGFSIEDLTPVELEQLIYEIREKDKGCMFLDGVLASKPRYT